MKLKKGIFWGVFLSPIILGIYFLFGGTSALAAGPHGHGEMMRGGFRGQQMMYGPHQVSGISWVGILFFLIIGITIILLFIKWLRKESKASSMQQFINTSIMSSHTPVVNQNTGSILDEWEKNITNEKENN